MTSVISIGDISEELSTFSLKYDEECLLKLKELCYMYQQTAEDIVEHWIAFSCSNSNCSLSISNLEAFQRDFLIKEVSKESQKNECINSSKALNTSQSFEENGVIDAYMTPDIKKKKNFSTPDDIKKKKILSSPLNTFSPSSFSPISSTLSQKYKSRLNASEVVSKLGDTENTNWKTIEHVSEKIDITLTDSTVLSEKYPYMFEKLRNKALIFNDTIDDVGQEIMNIKNIDHLNNVKSPQTDDVTVVGRICCDGNGKLNPSSILLEGSHATSNGSSVIMDVKNLPQYSLFPGQNIGFTGINNSGQVFIAKETILPKALPFSEDINKIDLDIQVVIACGPFTTKESLSYEPFYDLIKYVLEYKPHICILIGPFIDPKNELLENGNFDESYEELFQKIMANMLKMTEEVHTKFVLVPSSKDAHHEYIYPTPPYSIPSSNESRIYFASDPSMIKVNGIIIGLTSSDILLHLGKEEIWFPPSSSDRLKRLVTHLISQHSFYPLCPPSEEMNIDYEQAEKFVNFAVNPHILVVPSDLKNFIKDVDGCCCINPERITKGIMGGTFARLQIKASAVKSILPNITAEIVRI